MSATTSDRGRSQTLPDEQPRARRDERRSARPFRAAPLVDVEGDGQPPQEKKSKMRSFLKAIGFGCFFRGDSKRNEDDAHTADGVRHSRFSRKPRKAAALRAITIEDARHAFNQNVLDSEDGSVVSGYAGTQPGNPYVLFLGTEKNANFKPDPSRVRSNTDDPQIMDLSELRPSMHERALPVFFTPPPPDIVAAVTPRRKSFRFNDSPPRSPVGASA